MLGKVVQGRVFICYRCLLLCWKGCPVQCCHLSWIWTVVLDRLSVEVLLFVMYVNCYTGQVVQCNVVICHGCELLYWIGYHCSVVICHGCELLYWTGCSVQCCHLSWMWAVVLDKLFSAVLSFVINVSCCFGLLLNVIHSFYGTSCPSLFFPSKNHESYHDHRISWYCICSLNPTQATLNGLQDGRHVVFVEIRQMSV